MAKRRPNGDGMVRKIKGKWEGRIIVGHKTDGSPIFRYVYGKTQKELTEKMHQKLNEYYGAELTEDSNMTLGDRPHTQYAPQSYGRRGKGTPYTEESDNRYKSAEKEAARATDIK